MTTGIKQQVAVEDLAIGMFVSSLDIPMNNTRFPLGGFYIRTKEELNELSMLCNHVMVNITKGNLVRDLNSTLQLDLLIFPRQSQTLKGLKFNKEFVRRKKFLRDVKGELNDCFFFSQ